GERFRETKIFLFISCFRDSYSRCEPSPHRAEKFRGKEVGPRPTPLGAKPAGGVTWRERYSSYHAFGIRRDIMAARRDAWYIRLPNGQELRAKTTKAVVHHVETGIIPKNSLVRRTHAEEWTLLEWTAEFAEILADRPKKEPTTNGWHPEPGTGIASRLDPLRLRTVGIRSLWEDLLAALDSALSGGKPLVAALAGAVIG